MTDHATAHATTRKPRIPDDCRRSGPFGGPCPERAGPMPGLATGFSSEIERAQTASPDKIGADVVTMGAHVTFADEASGQKRVVQLVYPGEADIEAGRISILTPIGAALIGLSVGQSILWPDRAGKERALTILEVRRG